jgi:ribosomal protein L29
LESPIQIRDKRKYIARLKTEVRARQISNAKI